MEKFEKEEMSNGQSAAKALNLEWNEQRSTTIPRGSTGRNSGKQVVYHRARNVIYLILNRVTKNYYIGSTSYYDKRLGGHVSSLRRGKHKNKKLQKEYEIHGEKSLEFEIVEFVEKENLRVKEQYWLNLFLDIIPENVYNVCKDVNSRKGLSMSDSAKESIGNYQRGRTHSEERVIRKKIERTLAQGKAILVFDKEMNFLHEFPSVSETSRMVGVSIGSISKQCSRASLIIRKMKNSKYVFRYKDIV